MYAKKQRRKCNTCGTEFLSARQRSGKWTRTCSVRCRLIATERLLTVLERQRDALLEQLRREQDAPVDLE